MLQYFADFLPVLPPLCGSCKDKSITNWKPLTGLFNIQYVVVVCTQFVPSWNWSLLSLIGIQVEKNKIYSVSGDITERCGAVWKWIAFQSMLFILGGIPVIRKLVVRSLDLAVYMPRYWTPSCSWCCVVWMVISLDKQVAHSMAPL